MEKKGGGASTKLSSRVWRIFGELPGGCSRVPTYCSLSSPERNALESQALRCTVAHGPRGPGTRPFFFFKGKRLCRPRTATHITTRRKETRIPTTHTHTTKGNPNRNAKHRPRRNGKDRIRKNCSLSPAPHTAIRKTLNHRGRKGRRTLAHQGTRNADTQVCHGPRTLFKPAHTLLFARRRRRHGGPIRTTRKQPGRLSRNSRPTTTHSARRAALAFQGRICCLRRGGPPLRNGICCSTARASAPTARCALPTAAASGSC